MLFIQFFWEHISNLEKRLWSSEQLIGVKGCKSSYKDCFTEKILKNPLKIGWNFLRKFVLRILIFSRTICIRWLAATSDIIRICNSASLDKKVFRVARDTYMIGWFGGVRCNLTKPLFTVFWNLKEFKKTYMFGSIVDLVPISVRWMLTNYFLKFWSPCVRKSEKS